MAGISAIYTFLVRHSLCFLKKVQAIEWEYSIVVSTLDFESSSPSSILGIPIYNH